MSGSDWDAEATGYRVAVCDPLPLFRVGLMASLGDIPARIESTDDLFTFASEPDRRVVLLSVVGTDDWKTLNELCGRSPGLTVIALLDRPDLDSYCRAIEAGVSGVVPRAAKPNQISSACASAMAGEMILPATVVRALAERSTSRPQQSHGPSLVELEWLRDLAAGRTVAVIAERAGYSERMMFRLLRNLYSRLGVSNRTAALMLAHERNWL